MLQIDVLVLASLIKLEILQWWICLGRIRSQAFYPSSVTASLMPVTNAEMNLIQGFSSVSNLRAVLR
jgi:hypothetical protein